MRPITNFLKHPIREGVAGFTLITFLLTQLILDAPSVSADTLRPDQEAEAHKAGLEEALKNPEIKPTLSRRHFLQATARLGAAAPLLKPEEIFAIFGQLPTQVGKQAAQVFQEALKEEQEGQFLAYEGLENSMALTALKGIPIEQRKQIVGSLLDKREKLSLNTRYDALSNARDKVSVLLVDPSLVDPPASFMNPPTPDEVISLIANDPHWMLALFLFTRPKIPEVGLDVPASPPATRRAPEEPGKVLEFIELDMGELNKALARFQEEPMETETLFDGQKEWKTLHRLRQEAMQLPQSQRDRLTLRLSLERVRIQALLRKNGFFPPEPEILNRLTLARHILYEAQVDQGIEFAGDDTLLTHREFSKSLATLRREGLRTVASVYEAVVELAHQPGRRDAVRETFQQVFEEGLRQEDPQEAKIVRRGYIPPMAFFVAEHLDFSLGSKALWEAAQKERLSIPTDVLYDPRKKLSIPTRKPYEYLIRLYGHRALEEHASFLKRLFAHLNAPGRLDQSERRELLFLLGSHPFVGSQEYLDLIQPLLDLDPNSPLFFEPSLRWLVGFTLQTKEPDLQRFAVQAVKNLAADLLKTKLVSSYSFEEALNGMIRMATETKIPGLREEVLGLSEKLSRDPKADPMVKARALAAWASVLAQDPAEHSRVLAQFRQILQRDKRDGEITVGVVLDQLVFGSHWRQSEALVMKILQQFPGGLKAFDYKLSSLFGPEHEKERREYGKQTLLVEGVIFSLQGEAHLQKVPLERLRAIARPLQEQNRILPESSRVHRVVITGPKTYTGAGADLDPVLLLQLGYGLLQQEVFDRTIIHEMGHLRYYGFSQEERSRWKTLYHLLEELSDRLKLQGKVSAYELIDDSNFYPFDSETTTRGKGDLAGHPEANEDETFASSAVAFERNPRVLAGYIAYALDPESEQIGMLLWAYLRDRIFGRVFTKDGQDPFVWIQLGNPLGLLPKPQAGLEGSGGVQQWIEGEGYPILTAESREGSMRPGVGRTLNAVIAMYELPTAGLEEGGMNRREFLQAVAGAGIAQVASPILGQERSDLERVRAQLRARVARGSGLYLWELDLVPPVQMHAYIPALLDYVKRHQIRKVYFSSLPGMITLEPIHGMEKFKSRLGIWRPLLVELKKNGVQVWLNYSASWFSDPDPKYESLKPSEREGIEKQILDRDRALKDPTYAAGYDLDYAVPVLTRFNLKAIQEIINSTEFRDLFDGIYVHLEPYWVVGWRQETTEEDINRYLSLYLKFLENAHRVTTQAATSLMVNSWQGALPEIPGGIFEAEDHQTILWEGRPLLEAVQARAEIVNLWLQFVSPNIPLAALHRLFSEQNPGLPLEITLELGDDPWGKRTREFLPDHFWGIAKTASERWWNAPFSVTVRGLQPGLTAAPSSQAAETPSIGTLLHAIQIPLTEQERETLLDAYRTSKDQIEHAQPSPDGTYPQGFMDLISTPEGMRHRRQGALKAYPGIGQNSIHLRAPWGPTELFLGLEPGRGKIQFDGAMGTAEEFAVAFHGLPDPLKSELFQLMDAPETDRHLVAFIEDQWERIANTISDARARARDVRPIRTRARPLHFLPKGDFFVDVGTAEFGVTTARSNRPMLETLGLSQCVACVLWDPKKKVGGVAHFWWLRDPAFGMERFLEKFEGVGGKLGPGTRIHLIGGKTGESEWLILRLRALLQGKGVIVEEDILGNTNRHIFFDTRNGRIYDIYFPSQELKNRQARILYPASLRYAAGLEDRETALVEFPSRVVEQLPVETVSVEEFLERFPGIRVPEGLRQVYLVPAGLRTTIHFYAHNTLLSSLTRIASEELADLPEGLQVEVLELPTTPEALRKPGLIAKDWMLDLPYVQALLLVVELALGKQMPSLWSLVLYALRGAGGQVDAVIGVMTLEDARGRAYHAYFV